MNKLLILISKSAGGKDTILKQLIEKYNYTKAIPSYTTRPMRKGEVNGREYNFVTNEEFLEMLNQGYIIEHKIFETKYGTCYYGTNVAIKDQLKTSNLICIKEPSGVKSLINCLGLDNVVPILIEREGSERLISSLKRGDNSSEICRRFLADDKDFIEIEKQDIFKVQNYSIEKSVEEIHNYIVSNTYKHWNCLDDIKVEDKVIIDNINNQETGRHLLSKVGQEGSVFSYIIKNDEKRYKVMFKDESDTAYFLRNELKLVKKEGK